MILLGLGANLPSRIGPPRATLEGALAELEMRGANICRRSRWYWTAPIPVSDQPWYVNGVVSVETKHSPGELLACLHAVERQFGRHRGVKNAARPIDLDLLAYDDIRSTDGLELPHPRLSERAFVLFPLREVAPQWRHPVTGLTVEEMIRQLPADQQSAPLPA